jgi:hypothetical protein
MVVDPVPPPNDGGFGGGTGGKGTTGSTGHTSSSTGTGGFGGGMVVDPPPPDDAGLGALEIETDQRSAEASQGPRRLRLIDQWFDTSPKAAGVRTVDLPLFDPPRLKLGARREGEVVVVSLSGASASVSTRWEAEGEVEGTGVEVRWRPEGPADRIRVAIRSRGGVAVLSLRAEDAALVV